MELNVERWEGPDTAGFQEELLDFHLAVTEGLLEAAREVKAIHTSAFALSRDPCRETITAILRSVGDGEKIISLDPNFHPAIVHACFFEGASWHY